MDQQAIAAHADIPGPPSSMTLYANVLLKRQEDGYRLVYDLVTLAPEQRRLILILLHVSSQKGVRDSTVGRCLLQSCLQVAGFIDYSRHHPYGPGPFFSSRVSMLVPSIRVQHIRPSGEPGAGADVEIVDEWSVVPDPSLPAGSGHRDMFSVSLSHDKPVSIPPDMALLSMTCWMDGWKRMHIEVGVLYTQPVHTATNDKHRWRPFQPSPSTRRRVCALFRPSTASASARANNNQRNQSGFGRRRGKRLRPEPDLTFPTS